MAGFVGRTAATPGVVCGAEGWLLKNEANSFLPQVIYMGAAK